MTPSAISHAAGDAVQMGIEVRGLPADLLLRERLTQ